MAEEFDEAEYAKYKAQQERKGAKIRRPAVLPPTNQGISSPLESAKVMGQKAKIGLSEGLRLAPTSPDIGLPGAIGKMVGESGPPMAGGSAALAVTGLTEGWGAAGAVGVGATASEFMRQKLLELAGEKDKQAFNDTLADSALTGTLYGLGQGALSAGATAYKATIRPFLKDFMPSIFHWTSRMQPQAISRLIKNPKLMERLPDVSKIPDNVIVENLLTTVSQGKKLAFEQFDIAKSNFKKTFGDMLINMQPVQQFLEKQLMEAGAQLPGKKAAYGEISSLSGPEIARINKFISHIKKNPVLDIDNLHRFRQLMSKGMEYDVNTVAKRGTNANRIIKQGLHQIKELASATEQKFFGTKSFSQAMDDYYDLTSTYDELRSVLTNRKARATVTRAFKQGEGTPEWELLSQIDQKIGVGHKAFSDLIDTLTVKQAEKYVHPTSTIAYPRATSRAIQYGKPAFLGAEKIGGAIIPPAISKVAPAVFDLSRKQAQRSSEASNKTYGELSLP